MTKLIATAAGLAIAGSAFAQLDGQNIPTDAANNGLTLLATQDTPTGFGNATGGGQDSAGGSELNQLWASLDGTTLNLSITGNLEANFNKFFIFFDAVAGGEANLANDNSDGGFGEINNLAGLGFSGATMDHGLRVEIGGGFWGVNAFDLIDNSATSVASGGGAGDLPLSALSGAGVTFGWDNSNVLGVDDVDASGAATATTGWEFSIDLAAFFGEVPSSVNISAIVANDGGTFLSNQALPGIGGGGNLANPSQANLGFVTIPAPGATGLLALAGLAAARRRRA
jgi:hypothetical protein